MEKLNWKNKIKNETKKNESMNKNNEKVGPNGVSPAGITRCMFRESVVLLLTFESITIYFMVGTLVGTRMKCNLV